MKQKVVEDLRTVPIQGPPGQGGRHQGMCEVATESPGNDDWWATQCLGVSLVGLRERPGDPCCLGEKNPHCIMVALF